ncbi:MAG: hypothetical protein Q4F67_03850, partial [Propionibacteriaceae bacterium]|nr:hypothetical protein [Propionibacteriaceae bacterium]
ALVVLAVVAGLIAWRRDRGRLARLGVAVAVPVLLLAPWLPSLLRGWSRVLIGPDAGLRGLAVAEPWALLLGRTPGPGLPWFWLSAGCFGLLWVLALLAAVIRPTSIGLWGAWGTALASFALAVVLAGQLATAMPQGTRVRPDVVVLLLVTFASLLVAAALGFAPVAESLSRRAFGSAHLGTAAVAIATIAALLAGLVWWVVAGATGPVRRTEVDELPPFIRNVMVADARTRTLALEFDGDVPHWSLVADNQNRLGDADRGLAFGGSGSMQQRTSSMVARLVSGAGDERVADDLASMAVSHVWVSGATDEQRSRINNTPGLGGEAVLGDTVVWTVAATAGRYAITGGPEPVVVPARAYGGAAMDLPASNQARRLTIHEPTDPRWRIRFNGNELPVETGADRTMVDLPPQAGHLEVDLRAPVHPWLALAQLLVVLVVTVLSAPSLAGSRERRADIGARSADRRSLRAGRGSEPAEEPTAGRRAITPESPPDGDADTQILRRVEEDR